jgi:hypothetical protein
MMTGAVSPNKSPCNQGLRISNSLEMMKRSVRQSMILNSFEKIPPQVPAARR